MRKNRITYRTSQFFNSLFSNPERKQLERVNEILEPGQFVLFQKLQKSEQVHSIQIFLEIERLGFAEPDFLKAALLHDIGKTLHPLRIWERVLAVLCRWINQDCLDGLTEKDLRGRKRGLVIMKKHPEWGAELISNTDASQELVELIEKHQEGDLESTDPRVKEFLGVLRSIDDQY